MRACALNYYYCHCALPPTQQGFSGRFLYSFPVRTDWQAVLIIDDELHPGLAAQLPATAKSGPWPTLTPALVSKVNHGWCEELSQ